VAAARGLEAAHAQGLVHRDFKPENVLVAKDGRVLVCDFGVVGSATAGDDGAPEPSPASEGIVGTRGYMAPEQLGGKPVDGRADQYAFCVALDRALGKRRPRRLERLIRRGLAPDPAARHPSMRALADALERRPVGISLVAAASGVVVATAIG